VDMKAKREELNVLRQTELQMELNVETEHRKLLHLAKLLHGTQISIKQVRRWK